LHVQLQTSRSIQIGTAHPHFKEPGIAAAARREAYPNAGRVGQEKISVSVTPEFSVCAASPAALMVAA
jgi:hypothetical protein